jgi:hypothetical protein
VYSGIAIDHKEVARICCCTSDHQALESYERCQGDAAPHCHW